MSTTQLSTSPDTYVKNVALSTAFGGSNLTLRKLKALHVLALTVREQFFMRHPSYDLDNIHTITKKEIQESNSMYSIEESEVMRSMGYIDKTKYYSLNQVLNIFEELSNETIYFDGLGIVKHKTDSDSYTGFTRALGSAERENGAFTFYVPPSMVLYIINPEVSFSAPISWNAYSNKYTPAIYETCLYYNQTGKTYTDWFPIATLRQITSTHDLATYDKFNNFKERVLDIAIANINETDDFHLHLELEFESFNTERRPGRKSITHIRFKIGEKLAKLNQSADARNTIVLSAQKTEIESLGVAKHAIEDVLDECRDANGEISLPFVKWTVRRAHEVKSLTKFNNTANKDNNFGGYYRQKIVRDRKQHWFDIHNFLLTVLHQQGDSVSSMLQHDIEHKIQTLESRIKRAVALEYLTSLSDFALSHLRDSFQDFLENQLPHAYTNYINLPQGYSLISMAEESNNHLFFYLDYIPKIFNKDAYQSILNSKHFKN